MNLKPADITHRTASSLSSIKIGSGEVRYISIAQPADLKTLHDLHCAGEMLHIAGRGTNTTYGKFSGVVASIDLRGHEWDSSNKLKIYAGEDWQLAVNLSIERGLTGIERLTQIPGTVGAAPVQNIGAFGQTLSDRLESIEVYDYRDDAHLSLSATDCGFGSHRASNFKNEYSWQSYVITSVTLNLLGNY